MDLGGSQRQGLFEKYGLEAELVDFIEDKEVNAAFASGDMNAATLQPLLH
jgi:ABC-type nitrate/sulfonate/bicarbonate transport system substrate-binding protein